LLAKKNQFIKTLEFQAAFILALHSGQNMTVTARDSLVAQQTPNSNVIITNSLGVGVSLMMIPGQGS
jgi:hypothetical protein